MLYTFSSLLIGSFVWSGIPALAAEITPNEPTASTKAIEPANDSPLDEIVVTATRRSEPLSRVPLSISAFDSQALDARGIRSLSDLASFTAGARVDEASNQVFIRGIVSNAGAAPTGIYIDDTPIQIRNLGFSSNEAVPAIFDLARIEVLRGPQGTLFGAGSEGGTVRYISVQPSLTKWSSFARTEFAQISHGGLSYEAGLALGGPIVADHLGFRASAYFRRDGGWIDKTDGGGQILDHNTNHGLVLSLRGALAWQPVDTIRMTASLLYQRRLTEDDASFVEAISQPKTGIFLDSSPEFRRDPDRILLPSLKIEVSLGRGIQLIGNSSYYWRNNVSGYDGTIYNLSYYQTLPLDPRCRDGCAYPAPFLRPQGVDPSLSFYLSHSRVTNRQRIFTEEVRLQSTRPDAALSWVFGLFL